jgi:hypothetical protein
LRWRRHHRRTIFESGIDLDFAVSAGALAVSLTLFVLVVRKHFALAWPQDSIPCSSAQAERFIQN